MNGPPQQRTLTVQAIRDRKGGEPIVAVTAYDALFGRLVDEAGVDLVLVGDSVGNVVSGYDTTIPVTLEQMIYHGAATRRGVKRALLVVDMPFLTYQVDERQALLNCGRVMQQTGAAAVKVEGASDHVVRTVARLVEIGIPVMGHIGFMPQMQHVTGGARVQGRDEAAVARLMAEAERLEGAGVFALVLELLPARVAEGITRSIRVPTIGIGAGSGCDGQVLVLPDLLGLNDSFAPRFLKRYAELGGTVREAVRAYADDVHARRYPSEEHSF